ncbi:reverse transcriptase domain-containing protein [Tanacetum coccineum]
MELKTQLKTVAKNHQASIQNLENNFDRLADKQSSRPSGSLSGNTQPNPRGNNSKAYQPPQSRNEHVNVVFTRSADLCASINLMSYSLYAKLSLETLKPTKMSVRLADRSFQYPVGIAENMLVEVGKFTFLADFVILEMEEEIKVPLIWGRPFLHTADAIIREPSFLPVIISSQLSAQNKSKFVSVLKKHKEAFAWKTIDIPGICPSFCKHKIQLLDDKKPVILSFTHCGNKVILRVLRIILVILPEHPSDTKDHLKMEMEMEIPSVKASANSDIIFFFTSAQDGNKLLDDERLSLADDLKKAHDQNQNKSK